MHANSRKLAPLALGLWFASLGGACSDSGSSTDDAPRGVTSAKSALTRVATPSSANVSALGASNRGFAFDMYHTIASDHPNENLLFSPYSVSTALAMTYEGARGQTASEMQTTLHFDLERPQLHEAFNATDLALTARGMGQAGADGTPFRLHVNNSIWAQRDYPVVPAFLDVLALNYGAGVYLADFQSHPEDARMSINAWVSDKTEQLIPELLPKGSIDSLTRFVLTNTVYFNASWQKTFDEKLTTTQPFTKLDGSQVSAQMMHATRPISYAEGAGYRAIALPYSGDQLSFIAVLPDAGAYQTVEASLTAAWFDALRAQLQPTSFVLGLPKLDYKTAASLKSELARMGMPTAFGGAADFSGLTSHQVEITDVIHQAVLKVFEGGTIAAAATAVVIGVKGAVMSDKVVTFDRPFMLAIVDEPTGTILFLGRVLDPTEN